MNSQNNKWVMNPRPNPNAKLRLFCFPYAGGGASVYYPWMNELPSYIEVCPIQLPGRESRLGEKPYTRIDVLVKDLMKDMVNCLDKPFIFFGHSLGATISFDLARTLRKNKLSQPIHLFASGNIAPHLPVFNPLHNLTNEQFIERIRNYNGTPEIIFKNKELMELFIPILRADLELEETYQYSEDEPFDYPITVFGGEDDSEVSLESLIEWKKHTKGEFNVKMFPGGHFFIRDAQTSVLKSILDGTQ